MSQRLDWYDQKRYAAKQWKLLENLNIAKKMLILAKRIKKSASWKFNKKPIQNISYLNKKIDVYNKK